MGGDILANCYLIGVSNSSNDGNSGIKHSSLAATRQEIYRLSDFIFSANPNDTQYFLGKGVDKPKKVKDDYGSLKPCIFGSDAHSMNNVCIFPNDKFTWIKADPTFEGLKQILIETKRAERIEKTKKIFKDKTNVLSIYNKTKKGIDAKIKENEDLLRNYKINIDASLILNNSFRDRFLRYILQNKLGSFHSKEGGQIQLNNLIDGKDFNEFRDVELFLNQIIEYLFEDKRDKQNNELRFIDEQVKDIEEFYEYIFSLDYINFHYQLKLGDKEIEQLSPGERRALLLIFYLLLDENDIPLILDQPEDNLDNYSVANVLVPFIRRAKQKRQIILVTHNPNLAIVADAEQIIWVNIDKENKNKFEFISGSIENREINKQIVNVLEGTMPAFNKRKQKYYE